MIGDAKDFSLFSLYLMPKPLEAKDSVPLKQPGILNLFLPSFRRSATLSHNCYQGFKLLLPQPSGTMPAMGANA